jgi:DNA-binding NarL/FixJ family response regulator
MIRVISADDHAVVRAGVRLLLADAADIEVVGVAADGAELVQLLQSKPCDVLFLDITMPGHNGLALLKEVRSKWPAIAVVILSMHPEHEYAARALRAGAAGYLTKDSAPERLVDAARTVATGGRYVSPMLAQVLADHGGDNHGKLPHESLSDREYEVLVRIGAGKSVGEIADELFLSVNTVSTYRARILTKLGLATTAELIRYVVVNDLSV